MAVVLPDLMAAAAAAPAATADASSVHASKADRVGVEATRAAMIPARFKDQQLRAKAQAGNNPRFYNSYKMEAAMNSQTSSKQAGVTLCQRPAVLGTAREGLTKMTVIADLYFAHKHAALWNFGAGQSACLWPS
jgi:hypothetical protein